MESKAAGCVTDRAALEAEARERLEAQAAATSITNDNAIWFEQHWAELGSFEWAGMWVGKRRQFVESYNRRVILEALEAIDVNIPEEVYDLLSDAQIKKLVNNPLIRDLVAREIARIDNQDFGIVKTCGNWNYGPVKTKPSLDKYEIDEAYHINSSDGGGPGSAYRANTGSPSTPDAQQ